VSNAPLRSQFDTDAPIRGKFRPSAEIGNNRSASGRGHQALSTNYVSTVQIKATFKE
jgi:hypothetical protein